MSWVALVVAIAALALVVYVVWDLRRQPREYEKAAAELADSIEQLKVVLSLQLTPVLKKLADELNRLFRYDDRRPGP